MSHDKIGPKEAALRAQREARIEANKKLIDRAARMKPAVAKVRIKKTGRGR